MVINGHRFDLLNNSYIMGILNVTPDSFSDGDLYKEVEKALHHTENMIRDGAAIIDIGGESTRPGHTKITEAEEILRVVPVIEAVRSRFDVAISLDTYKYEVAKAGIEAGAGMINDIWGLKWDSRLAKLIAETGSACCLMHNREDTDYPPDFFSGFLKDMEETLQIAEDAGIAREQIILDPGIGFAKSHEQNLLLLKHLDVLSRFDLPILLGTSRKSVIGHALHLPVEEREEGTAATTVMGRMKGASIFRVHNVKANARALMMTDAVLGIQI